MNKKTMQSFDGVGLLLWLVWTASVDLKISLAAIGYFAVSATAKAVLASNPPK